MKDQYFKLCALCGPMFCIMFMVGFIGFAGFMPPLPPSATAVEIANIYIVDNASIKTGLIIMMIGLSFSIPFVSAIVTRMKQMRNSSSTLVTTFIIVSAAVAGLLFILICAWAVASYRIDRSPEIIQAFNDFAFILLIWPVSLIPVSYISLGLAVLSDDKNTPIFPRWFAFLNFWFAVLAYGGCLLIFFVDGPFAWDGLIAFWIPAVAFFGWYIVTSVVLLQSNDPAELVSQL
ncbi:hypothetical protein RI845_11260 [Thalassotalea nanhaiensis]|uniref:DUF4386 domain-containing protein n=1 Tax=Thalassotalea nanhaiensis TaxID=3065648 RepID=A0ABY9TE83_9GAMM|nr:hypothetical protein RI845_11260 [Colwelliaceae bacterium SQ345]